MNIEELMQKIEKKINTEECYNLTVEELDLIDDSKKEKEYYQKIKRCIKYILNPLHGAVKPKRGEINTNTCKTAYNDLIKICEKRNMKTEDIYNAIFNDLIERCKKKDINLTNQDIYHVLFGKEKTR